jgi:hypothetical protein
MAVTARAEASLRPDSISGVVLLSWPEERAALARLRRAGTPRLLVVPDGVCAPQPVDELEDWTRYPVPESDLHARARTLARRARERCAPDLDDQGLLRFGGRLAVLTATETRLARSLVAAFDRVVDRDDLLADVWPRDPAIDGNRLDVCVLRLRRKLAPLALGIRTARGRGYGMCAARDAVAGQSSPE